jgi:hypothetical protein
MKPKDVNGRNKNSYKRGTTGLLAFSHLEDECGVGGMVIM